jgi:hypothetical protein
MKTTVKVMNRKPTEILTEKSKSAAKEEMTAVNENIREEIEQFNFFTIFFINCSHFLFHCRFRFFCKNLSRFCVIGDSVHHFHSGLQWNQDVSRVAFNTFRYYFQLVVSSESELRITEFSGFYFVLYGVRISSFLSLF